jgi:AhpD family alkylhydroperoxidase
MIPNLMGMFANHPQVLDSYLAVSQNFNNSGFSPLEQQIVLISTSRENDCTYCVAAHTVISNMNKLDEKVILQLRNGEVLEDKKFEALRTFTKRMVSARGFVDASDVNAFLAAGYSQEQTLAVILGVGLKTISNYMNHMAMTPLDGAFTSAAWSKGLIK